MRSSTDEFVSSSDKYKSRLLEREVWKDWFNDEKSNWKGQNNPIVYWKNKNLDSVNEFEKSLKKAYDFVAKNNKIPGL